MIKIIDQDSWSYTCISKTTSFTLFLTTYNFINLIPYYNIEDYLICKQISLNLKCFSFQHTSILFIYFIINVNKTYIYDMMT